MVFEVMSQAKMRAQGSCHRFHQTELLHSCPMPGPFRLSVYFVKSDAWQLHSGLVVE